MMTTLYFLEVDGLVWLLVKIWIALMVMLGFLAWTFWLSKTRHK